MRWRLAPIAGLDEAAHGLLTIWDALQHVDVRFASIYRLSFPNSSAIQTIKLACLRLTERCAEILLAGRAEVHDAGDKVGEELAAQLDRLTKWVLLSDLAMLRNDMPNTQLVPLSTHTAPEAGSSPVC